MSARERFRASKTLVAGYNDTVDSDRMQAAFDAAMLHFMDTLSVAKSPDEAVANNYRAEGALRVIGIIKNLNAEIEKVKRPNTGNLNPI